MLLRNTSLAAFGLALVTTLTGCPTESTGTDAATRPADAFVPPGEDAPSMMMADAPSMMMADSPAMMGEDAPMASPDAVVTPATWGEVHTALTTSCAPCHSGLGSGGHNMAAADVMAAYTDSQLAAGRCAGVTKGACAAMRVRAGTMPPGGLAEPMRTELANLLDGWVTAGQPAP